MKWFACLLVLLAACSMFGGPSDNSTDESLITGDVVVELDDTIETEPRTDIIIEPVEMGGDIVPIQTNVSETSDLNQTEFVEIPKDYTIGEVHMLTPQLEDAVKASPCYQYTWEGISQYNSTYKLNVKKSIRFSYMGARLFKGWILSTMTLNGKQVVDTKSVQVLVNEMQVTCVDEGNFSFDWNKLSK
jgi:hypothetical protein